VKKKSARTRGSAGNATAPISSSTYTTSGRFKLAGVTALMKLQVDSSIIEEIERLREAAKCPFCGGKLEFQRYESSFRDPSITLRCKTCNPDFEFQREEDEGLLAVLGSGRKQKRWELTRIEKGW